MLVVNLCLRHLFESQTVVLQTSSPCIATDNVVLVAGRLAQHMQSDTDATDLLGGVKTDAEVAQLQENEYSEDILLCKYVNLRCDSFGNYYLLFVYSVNALGKLCGS